MRLSKPAHSRSRTGSTYASIRKIVASSMAQRTKICVQTLAQANTFIVLPPSVLAIVFERLGIMQRDEVAGGQS